MRISAKKSEEHRRDIIASAEKLFRARGFEAVSVAEFMRAAGLTHGGFYNHFGSKSELEAEAIRHACAQAVARVEKLAQAPEDQRRSVVEEYMDAYLSPRARDATTPRCASLAYGGEAPRAGKQACAALAEGLEAYVENLAVALNEPGMAEGGARTRAIQTFASMVGGLYLARAVASADKSFSDEILTAVRDDLRRD
jgi:TetR/AcrR family transcriptional repressor of nem operon